RAGADEAPPLPRRAGSRAPRPPASAASRPGDAGARPVSPHVRRNAPRELPPDADPSRAVPAGHLRHDDAAVGRNVPPRRPGRGNVEDLRGLDRGGTVRDAPPRGAPRAERGDGAVPRVSALTRE